MKALGISLFILAVSLFATSCIIVDDDCRYETRCNYICDVYGHNCVADTCWDEWVCEDDYHYYP